MSYARWQKFVRTLTPMCSPWHPPKRPTFLTDDELEIRRAVAKDLMGDIQPKGHRKLIQENTYRESTRWGWDGNGSPIE
jgi:hypothetical protein